MDLDADFVDEDFLFEPAPAAVPAVRKFQPKGKVAKPVKAHPKTGKHVQAPSKALVVAAQLPPVTEAPVCVSDTKTSDEKPSLPIATIDKSLIDVSGIDSTRGSASQLEVFSSKPRISDVNEDTAVIDEGEAEKTGDLDTNSLVEDAIVPPAYAVQELDRSPPESHPKTVNQVEAPASSNAPIVATQRVPPPIRETLVRISDSKSPDDNSSLAVTAIDDPLLNASDLDSAHGSAGQMEAFPSEPLVSGGNEDISQCEQGEGEGAMDFGTDYVDEDILFQPAPAAVRAVPKFQPKKFSKTAKPVKAHPKTRKPLEISSKESVVASQLAPPVCISDTMSTDKTPSLQTASIDDSFVDASGLDSIHGSSCQEEVFPSEPLIAGGNMDTAWSDQGEGKGAIDLDTDSVGEDFLLPPAPAVRTLDAHTKFVKPVETSSKPPVMASQLTPPIMEPLVRISDLKSPDKKSSLPISSVHGSLINASDLDKANGSVCHPEASLSESLISNFGEDTSQRYKGEGEGSMDLDTNSLAKDFLFPIASSDDSAINAFDLNTTQGPECHPETFSSEAVVCSGNYEDTSQLDRGKWEGAKDLNTDSLAEDCFLPSAPLGASKFRPKLITRPKERKVKKVSFNFSDTVETVHTVDTHISFAQSDGGEKLTCNTTEVESSFVQMLCEGSLDEAPDSACTVSDCNEDAGMDQLNYEEEDISEILGLESLEKHPSQLTSKIGKFQPKISSRNKSVKPNARSTTRGVKESENDSFFLESESLEGHTPIVPPYSLFDSVTTSDSTPTDLILEQPSHVDTCTHEVASHENNHLVGKEQTLHLSIDINKSVWSHDSEHAEPILNEKSTSKVVEDQGASKATRKLRKRVNKLTPTDKIHENREVDNSNIQEGEGIHGDDGCREEEAPKQKRARRIPKKPVIETEKPTRKRKKASEELESTPLEPVKKKFPRATQRKRRQVNKELLLMPEEEIDRSQLSIKDLIRTYEAKERISKKETAAGGNSSFNQRANPFGTNGEFWGQEDFENYDGQDNVTTTKWNHHSFRKNPTSTSRWSKAETDLFYQALRQFGTNFEMIQKLFPGRTRHQMTLKFKNERRKYPLQIADATTHPSKDFSLVKLVMQALADEEKEKAKKKVYYVNNDEDEYEEENEQSEKEEQEANDLEGGLDKEEQEANDWEGGLDKEEQEADEWEDGFESSAKPDNYEDTVQSSNQFYEENSQWDGNDSYYQDTETDEFSFLL